MEEIAAGAWAFAPERLREAVDEVLAVAREVGSPGGGPSDRPDAALITRWTGSPAAALGGEIRLDARPRVEILRVVNRPGQLEDRVIVRVRLRLLRRHHPLVDQHTLTLDQRWTFGRAGELWALRSIDSSSSEERTLAQRLIPTEWTDEQRCASKRSSKLPTRRGSRRARASARSFAQTCRHIKSCSALADRRPL